MRGEFVTAAQVQANPAMTVTETIPAPSPVIAAAGNLASSLREHRDLSHLSASSLRAYDALMTALNA